MNLTEFLKKNTQIRFSVFVPVSSGSFLFSLLFKVLKVSFSDRVDVSDQLIIN